MALDGYGVSGLETLSKYLARKQLKNDTVTAKRAAAIVTWIGRLGLTPTPKVRRVGQYEIPSLDPISEGPRWIDVRVKHPNLPGQSRRLRLFDLPPRAKQPEREIVERMARRELQLTARLNHLGIERPLELFVEETGPALLFNDDADTLSLRQYLADNDVSATQRLGLIHRIGEVVQYAHSHGVQHKALASSAIRVRPSDGGPKVLIRDWQSGQLDPRDGVTAGTTLYQGVTDIQGRVPQDALLYLAPECSNQDAPGVPMDVYGLGSLAFLILTDEPPAADLEQLRQRLAAGGLDPAAVRDGVPELVCDVVKRATSPEVSERIASVADLLDDLTAAAEAEPTEVAPYDPREADPGDVVADRWEVKARLGSGGSGVALLVDDYTLERESLVLKIAVDAGAGPRLETEADILRDLDHPRLVRLVDGPVQIDGHTAILLEDAGRPTLGKRLHDEGRLTLEQLEGYGRDLFEAVALLEDKRIFHRDIKPDNLGVRETRGAGRGDRARHLVLFDFSLSDEPLENVRSGTQGYLDPFLGVGRRRNYDSAAERFAAAATLFAMATGRKPEWGDGQSDPALISDEVHVAESMFEPEVATSLCDFFGKALARDAASRFDDVESMATAWGAAFPAAISGGDEEATQADLDKAAEAATPATDLARSGLTPRAVSAARRLGAHTVQELVDASAFAINTLPGVGVKVRSELQRRRRQWRERFASTATTTIDAGPLVRGVERVQESLVPSRRSKASHAAALARQLVNLDTTDSVNWPDHGTAAQQAGVDGDPSEQVAALVAHWAKAPIVADLAVEVADSLAALGGVATVEELAERLVALRGSTAEGPARRRNAVGLVRAVAEADQGERFTWLRHGGAVLITTTAGEAEQRLEAAALLAETVDEKTDPSGPLGANEGVDLVRRHPRYPDLGQVGEHRALSLAARASARAALSSRSEIYPRDMPAAAAVAAVLRNAHSRITPRRLTELAAARFPAAASVPTRPALDALVLGAGTGLTWNDGEGAYVRPTDTSTSILTTGTIYVPQTPVFDEVDEALKSSLSSRSAVVLAVAPQDQARAARDLVCRYGVTAINVSDALVAAMKDLAVTAGVDWSLVLRADAADPGSADRTNLERLVSDAVERFWAPAMERDEPLMLTDLAPLARYGQTARLAELLDTATSRPAARWLLVTKRAGSAAPTLDGTALPMAGGTWVQLPESRRESA